MKAWKNTVEDVQVRDGDVLFVPKKAGYVMVNGQVFNPTAVSYVRATAPSGISARLAECRNLRTRRLSLSSGPMVL